MHTEAPPMEGTIKVRALRTGYYAHVRMRGDDTLGAGQGDVFVLEPRDITVYDSKAGRPVVDRTTGKVETKHITAEDQFSPLWMEKVDADVPLNYTTAQMALNHANDEMTTVKRRRK